MGRHLWEDNHLEVVLGDVTDLPQEAIEQLHVLRVGQIQQVQRHDVGLPRGGVATEQALHTCRRRGCQPRGTRGCAALVPRTSGAAHPVLPGRRLHPADPYDGAAPLQLGPMLGVELGTQVRQDAAKVRAPHALEPVCEDGEADGDVRVRIL